jgi:hypothetical protein
MSRDAKAPHGAVGDAKLAALTATESRVDSKVGSAQGKREVLASLRQQIERKYAAEQKIEETLVAQLASLRALDACFQSHTATPLMLCAIYGHVRIAQKLVAAGAHVEAREEVSGKTALMFAAEYGQFDVTKHLLEAKANVNTKEYVWPCFSSHLNADRQKVVFVA